MSKRTYTPSIAEIDRRHGERYYTVSVGKRHRPHNAALQFGTLDTIIGMMDATIYGIDPDADDLAQWSARISYAGRDLVIMPDCKSPDSAQVCPQPAEDAYEVRQVDAIAYDDGWTYNETYRLGTFTTTGDVSRALRRYLAKSGITFYPGRTATVYDGDVYEIVDRKTGEPLFCAIPAAGEA